MVITNKNKKSLKSEFLEKIRKMADPEFSAEYFEDAMRKFKIMNAKGLNNLNTMVLSRPKSFIEISKELILKSKSMLIGEIKDSMVERFRELSEVRYKFCV